MIILYKYNVRVENLLDIKIFYHKIWNITCNCFYTYNCQNSLKECLIVNTLLKWRLIITIIQHLKINEYFCYIIGLCNACASRKIQTKLKIKKQFCSMQVFLFTHYRSSSMWEIMILWHESLLTCVHLFDGVKCLLAIFILTLDLN